MVLAEIIIAAVVAIFVVITVVRSIRIVPQARARNVERCAIGTFVAPLPHRIEVLERKSGRIDHAMAAGTGLVRAV